MSVQRGPHWTQPSHWWVYNAQTVHENVFVSRSCCSHTIVWSIYMERILFTVLKPIVCIWTCVILSYTFRISETYAVIFRSYPVGIALYCRICHCIVRLWGILSGLGHVVLHLCIICAQATNERITVHDSFPSPFTARTMLWTITGLFAALSRYTSAQILMCWHVI